MKTFIVLSLLVGVSLAQQNLKIVCNTVDGKIECVTVGDYDMPDIIQGDMIVSENETIDEFGRNAVLHRRWPGGEIQYVFHELVSDSEKKSILEGMDNIMSETCVKFVPYSGRGPVVQISVHKKGCFASVGISDKGIADINLNSGGCSQPGVIQHELLHVVGLHHEQSRPDRDDYVIIYWDNIAKDKQSNFNKRTDSDVTTFGLPYDYKSLMHYGNNLFAIDRKLPTITAKKHPKLKLGQYRGPTKYDLEKLLILWKLF